MQVMRNSSSGNYVSYVVSSTWLAHPDKPEITKNMFGGGREGIRKREDEEHVWLNDLPSELEGYLLCPCHDKREAYAGRKKDHLFEVLHEGPTRLRPTFRDIK